jgi:hypothetical protein
MKPNIWGKHYWFVFHVVGMKYPEMPSVEDRMAYANFYRELWRFIPCNTCSTNYVQHFQQFPVEEHLDNKSSLFKWTVDFHNIVSASLGKPTMTLNDATAHYSEDRVEMDEVVIKPVEGHCDHHLAINTMLYINALFIIMTTVFIVWIWNKKQYKW